MIKTNDFESIGELLAQKKQKKTPAYPWQDLALRIINELKVPDFKKNAVFRVCRDIPSSYLLFCLREAKEMAKTQPWKYFFKLANQGYINHKKKK